MKVEKEVEEMGPKEIVAQMIYWVAECYAKLSELTDERGGSKWASEEDLRKNIYERFVAELEPPYRKIE